MSPSLERPEEDSYIKKNNLIHLTMLLKKYMILLFISAFIIRLSAQTIHLGCVQKYHAKN